MTISPKNLSMFNNQLSIVIQNEKAPGAPPPQGPFPSLLRHHHSVPQQPTSCPFGIHPQGGASCHRLWSTTVPGWSSRLTLGNFVSIRDEKFVSIRDDAIFTSGHNHCKIFLQKNSRAVTMTSCQKP